MWVNVCERDGELKKKVRGTEREKREQNNREDNTHSRSTPSFSFGSILLDQCLPINPTVALTLCHLLI